MLNLADVRSGYPGRPVLLGLHLDLDEGSSTALLGRNGVGKTTLMKTIVGALPCASGSIRFGGHDVTRAPTHERALGGIAYVPQGRHVFAGLTVKQNLRVAAQAVFGKRWREQVDAALEQFPKLAEKQTDDAGSLSGGQQQILALARAMVSQPRLLLLDEPSEGISPAALDEIVELVRGLIDDRGIGVLIAEQNLGFASRIATEAVVLDRGAVAVTVGMSEIAHSDELQRRYLAI